MKIKVSKMQVNFNHDNTEKCISDIIYEARQDRNKDLTKLVSLVTAPYLIGAL